MRNLIVVSTIALAALTTVAEARDRHHRGHHRGHYHHHRGGHVLPWIAGGAALGILGGAYYYNSCRWERRPVYNRWGDFVGYRDVRTCD